MNKARRRLNPFTALILIFLSGCAGWHPATKPDPKLLFQALPVTDQELITYYQGHPILQTIRNEADQPVLTEYQSMTNQPLRLDRFQHPNPDLTRQEVMGLPDSQRIWSLQIQRAGERIISRDWYDNEEKLLGRETFTYDPGGLLMERRLISSSKTVLRIKSRNPLNTRQWMTNLFDQAGKWTGFRVTANEPFYWHYYLTPAGYIQRVELRTREDQRIWRAEYQPKTRDGDLVSIFSGTGQLILQTRHAKSGRVLFIRDSLPRLVGSLWNDGSLFNLERSTLTDSTELLVWHAVKNNVLVRRQQVNLRTGLPIEDIFYYSTGPQHPIVWYVYDYRGFLRRSTNYAPDGMIAWVRDYDRTPTGQLIRTRLTNGQGELHETVWYHYAPGGALVFQEHQGPFGKITGSTQYFSDSPQPLIRLRDAAGKIVKDITTLPSGDTLRWAKYIDLDFIWVGLYYDQQDHLISERRVAPDETYGQTLHFDARGRRTYEEFFRKDGSIFEIIRHHEPEGFRLRETYSPGGQLLTLDSTYVRPDGQSRRAVALNEFGRVETLDLYTYKDSIRIKGQRLNGAGKMVSATTFERDSLGQLKAIAVYDSSHTLMNETRFQYDLKGRKLGERVIGKDGQVIEEHRFQYSLDGKLYRQQVLQSGGLVESVEYKYLRDLALRVVSYYTSEGELARREIEDTD